MFNQGSFTTIGLTALIGLFALAGVAQGYNSGCRCSGCRCKAEALPYTLS